MHARPEKYKKSQQKIIEKNYVRFSTHLDSFIGVLELPGRYKNLKWHKTDCSNVLLDFLLEVHSATSRPFSLVAGAAAGLWTEPQTFGEIVSFLFSNLFMYFYVKKKIVYFFYNLWFYLF